MRIPPVIPVFAVPDMGHIPGDFSVFRYPNMRVFGDRVCDLGHRRAQERRGDRCAELPAKTYCAAILSPTSTRSRPTVTARTSFSRRPGHQLFGLDDPDPPQLHGQVPNAPRVTTLAGVSCSARREPTPLGPRNTTSSRQSTHPRLRSNRPLTLPIRQICTTCSTTSSYVMIRPTQPTR